MQNPLGKLFSDAKKSQSWKKIAQKYPVFSFESYSYVLVGEDLIITFVFSFSQELTFRPTVVLKNIPVARFKEMPKNVIDNLVFHLGIVEGFSYWKACAPKTYAINCGSLQDEQVNFFKHIFRNGMGEYAFTNAIDLSYLDNVAFTSSSNVILAPYEKPLTPQILIPVGGGKDSAVTVELAKQLGKNKNIFLLNPITPSKNVTKIAGFENPLVVERTIDPLLLSLNQKGYLNGHTPFSAYLAFLTTLCAVLFDYQEIVLSNEHSANVGNVEYQGKEINHQYSKSFDFEEKFHRYAQAYLANTVNYFSLLRPLFDIQIAKIFSQYSQYFSIFLSCNVGQKDNRWCGNCAKCLFVFATLYPFVQYEQLVKIFANDLFMNADILPIAKDLIGETKQKPFDCVGTYEEVRAAFYLSLKNKRQGQVLLDYFETEVLPKYPSIATDIPAILATFNRDNLLPRDYLEVLQKNIV